MILESSSGTFSPPVYVTGVPDPVSFSRSLATAPLPDDIKSNWAAYTGCVAGASQITELERMLEASGFKDIKIAPKDSSRSFIREHQAHARNHAEVIPGGFD